MAIMFGNGSVLNYAGGADNYIMKTETFVATNTTLPTEATSLTDATNVSGWEQAYTAPDNHRYLKVNPKFYEADGKNVADALVSGTKYFCTYDLAVTGSVIEISANSFPGTYYVTGDTYARNENSGVDEFFQFIIPRAKVQSENTITLEAEGDPSVFNLNLRVMRPADGKMMKLVKYSLDDGEEISSETSTTLIHNHKLEGANTAG